MEDQLREFFSNKDIKIDQALILRDLLTELSDELPIMFSKETLEVIGSYSVVLASIKRSLKLIIEEKRETPSMEIEFK